MSAEARSTVDDAEVRRFSEMAADWWDPAGPFRALHKFGTVRLGYIKEEVSARFGRDARDTRAFEGLRILDIGCGGGLLSEPMARLGADVVGADAAAANIEAARLHAAESGLAIDYRATTAEALAEAGERFDVVLAMEIVEHVADVGLFVEASARMVRPGGLLFMATINRTVKSYALAIVGAEMILRWLPRGTHTWSKFVRPRELADAVAAAGLDVIDEVGVVYDPIADRWSRHARDLDVNYMLLAGRPAAA
jgi:2-polyprenyl-6-hydroxyphenyl methylase/3-demethylubiquinone-9 3-methyltransferase